MLTILAAAALNLWPIPATAAPFDQFLLRAYYVQDDACRGYSDEPHIRKACAWRDDSMRMLQARGWRWSDRQQAWSKR